MLRDTLQKFVLDPQYESFKAHIPDPKWFKNISDELTKGEYDEELKTLEDPEKTLPATLAKKIEQTNVKVTKIKTSFEAAQKNAVESKKVQEALQKHLEDEEKNKEEEVEEEIDEREKLKQKKIEEENKKKEEKKKKIQEEKQKKLEKLEEEKKKQLTEVLSQGQFDKPEIQQQIQAINEKFEEEKEDYTELIEEDLANIDKTEVSSSSSEVPVPAPKGKGRKKGKVM